MRSTRARAKARFSRRWRISALFGSQSAGRFDPQIRWADATTIRTLRRQHQWSTYARAPGTSASPKYSPALKGWATRNWYFWKLATRRSSAVSAKRASPSPRRAIHHAEHSRRKPPGRRHPRHGRPDHQSVEIHRPRSARIHRRALTRRHSSESNILLYVTSFGVRKGIPPESDLVFDVPLPPNPIPRFKD